MNDAGIVIGETTVLADAVRRRGHAAEQPHPQGHPVRLVDRRGGGHPAREEQRDVHERLDPRRREARRGGHPAPRDGAVEAVALDRPAGAVRDAGLPVGEQQRARRRRCAARWRRSPRTRPTTRPSRPRTATSPSGASTRSTRGRSTCRARCGLMASSPINRPHACDGKVTDAQMAEKLVFMAHQGKVTLREKFPVGGQPPDARPAGRGPAPDLRLRDVQPDRHRRAAEGRARGAGRGEAEGAAPRTEAKAVADRYAFTRDDLWHGTFFPASDADNWLVAGSAAYWQILRGLPEKAADRPDALARAARRPPEPARLRHVARDGRRRGEGRRRLRPLRAVPRPAGQGRLRPPPAAAPLREQGVLRLHEGLPRAPPRAGGHDRAVPRRGPRRARPRRGGRTCGRGSTAPASPTPCRRWTFVPQGKEWRVTRARDAAGRGLPPRHDRRGGGRRQALPLPDDRGGREGRGHVHRPGEAPPGGVRRPRRLPGGDRPPLRLRQLRRGLHEDADRLRHRPAGRGEPHARPALPVGPGRRLLGDPAARRPGRRGGRGRARRARPLRARRPARTTRSSPASCRRSPSKSGRAPSASRERPTPTSGTASTSRCRVPSRRGACCTSSSPTAPSSSTR